MNQTQITKYAERKLREHGLAKKGWKFRVEANHRSLANTCGRCLFNSKTVTIVSWLLKSATPYIIRDVVKHEIAHAMSGEIDHNDRWKAYAKRVGAMPYAFKSGKEVVK